MQQDFYYILYNKLTRMWLELHEFENDEWVIEKSFETTITNYYS